MKKFGLKIKGQSSSPWLDDGKINGNEWYQFDVYNF